MKRVISLIVVMVMLVMPGTAIAADNDSDYINLHPCGFLSTISDSRNKTRESHYINPKEISHITIIKNNTTAVGTSGRYMLFVIMTNGDNLLYGVYGDVVSRQNVISYISKKVMECK